MGWCCTIGYGDCDDADPSLNNEDLDADGYSTCTGDCDDADPFVYSGAASNDSATECMRDEDGDGYGDIVDSGCCYSLILTDSYGDGWNGADLDLVVEQNIVESFENTDLNLDGGCFSGCEESVVEDFCVADGSSFSLMFNSGAFDSRSFRSPCWMTAAPP